MVIYLKNSRAQIDRPIELRKLELQSVMRI